MSSTNPEPYDPSLDPNTQDNKPWRSLEPREQIALLEEMLDRTESSYLDLLALHAKYFNLYVTPGSQDSNPDPEDLWRYDRDFREAVYGDGRHTVADDDEEP